MAKKSFGTALYCLKTLRPLAWIGLLCLGAMVFLAACAGEEPKAPVVQERLQFLESPCTTDEGLVYIRELREARNWLDQEFVAALLAMQERDLESFKKAAQRFHSFAQQADSLAPPRDLRQIQTAWSLVSKDLTKLIRLIEQLWAADGELSSVDYEKILRAFELLGPSVEELSRAVFTVCKGSSLDEIYSAYQEGPQNRFVAVSSGGFHTCALNESGETICWGALPIDSPRGFRPVDFGQTQPPEGERLVAISSGGFHTCGLRKDGTAVCWGARIGDSTDGYGTVGHGQTSAPEDEVFVAISSGGAHTCGLREEGSPVCWGSNGAGQSMPPAGERFVSISSGSGNSCGLREDGIAVCWGPKPYKGEYGGYEAPPEDQFVFIDSASGYTCGILRSGYPKCWGAYTDVNFPARYPTSGKYTSISGGPNH